MNSQDIIRCKKRLDHSLLNPSQTTLRKEYSWTLQGVKNALWLCTKREGRGKISVVVEIIMNLFYPIQVERRKINSQASGGEEASSWGCLCGFLGRSSTRAWGAARVLHAGDGKLWQRRDVYQHHVPRAACFPCSATPVAKKLPLHKTCVA